MQNSSSKHPRHIGRCVSGLVLAAALLLAGPTAGRCEDRALIIGINKYAYLGEKSQLSGAVNDARAMAGLAKTKWGFKPQQIKILLDADATAQAIRSALRDWIVADTSPGDRALIYFSGHGYFVEDTSGDEADGRDEVIVPYDGKLLASGYENFVIDDEIERVLREMADRQVMLLSDSCHSGTIERSLVSEDEATGSEGMVRSPTWTTEGMRGGADKDLAVALKTSEQAYKKLRQANSFVEARDVTVTGRGSLLVWTAAAATQLAQEDASLAPGARQGVFTRAFVDGIGGAADSNGDGKVTASEVLTYARAKAENYCASFACKTGMTPTFEPGGSELGRDMSVWPVGAAAGDAGQAPLDPTDVIPVPPEGFSVKLAIEPGSTVRLGQSIKLRIESSRPGTLIVLDARDDGKVFQLFPSVCTHKERAIRANAPLLMPDPSYGCVFKADEAGQGKIIAIVAEDKVPLDTLLEGTRAKGIDVIGRPSEYLGSIAEALLTVWTGDPRNRPVKWGLATASYEIVK